MIVVTTITFGAPGGSDVEIRVTAATFGSSGVTGRRTARKDEGMRFMLLQDYGGVESDCPPMAQWTPAEIKAHIDFQNALNAELLERGELVDA